MSLSVRLLSLSALLAFAAFARAEDSLAAGFATPPPDARPRTFWHWMNGNVTRDGITRDLEAMQRIGIGGVMIFDGSDYLPAGAARYLEPHWRELMTHAIREGNRLGVDVGMHNAPGWSSSGGPWVTPEQSMQQLVWTETTVAGGRRVEIDLTRPQTNRGFYRDAFVIAFPALTAEKENYETALAGVTAGSTIVPKEVLSDGQLDTVVRLTPADPLVFEFRQPVDLYALTAQPTATGRFPRLDVEVSPDGVAFTPVCSVGNPGRHGIVAPAVRNFASVSARFVRVKAAEEGEVAEFVLHRTPRIEDWVAKANFDYRVTGQMAPPTPVGADAEVDPRAVIDLTAQLHGEHWGWDAPPGAWTVLRIGHTSTGKENVAASAAGRGLEIDKFSAGATDFHVQHVIDVVRTDASAAGAKGPATVTIDSYEAGMQNWTENFPAEFRRRAGYEITPYLPALFGRTVGDAGIADRFLFDFRRVQAALMAENYYGRMGRLVAERDMRFFVEGYGPGNFDELKVAGSPEVPMTEFWTRTPWTPNRTVKMVTSAAHVYGKPVVAAESFTGEAKTSRWLEYPYALKILGDDMFAQGMNLMVFHTYAHQPHPDAAPGMTLGPYGFGFSRTNTWFAQARPWIDYLARSQFLLRQGTYTADVLYFTGERTPDPSQFALPVLPTGYTYDLVNTDVLLNRLTFRDGAYELPEGGRYRLLVLPPDLKAMRLELLKKLRDFVAAGGVLLGPKPTFSPTLESYPASEREMLRLADELWAPDRKGAGRVFATGSIADVIAQLSIVPDVTYAGSRPDAALSWQHRKLSEGDLFFLGNRQRRTEEVTVSFRGMAGRQAELWSPETGERRVVVLQDREGDRARVPVQFDPAESVFVLFRTQPTAKAVSTLTRDGQPVATTLAITAPAQKTSGGFTMAIWVKPDTDLRVMPKESTTDRIDEVGKFYAIPADPGDRRFGPGHATAGLAVGRNGIFVVERANDSCPAVLVAEMPVSGWTHVAVLYRDGKPRLYVNGAFVREGLASGKIVHSGVGSPVPPVDYTLNFPGIEALTRAAGQPPPPSRGQVYFFEGNFVPAETIVGNVSDADVAALFAKGVPAPVLPTITEVTRQADGKAVALAWQSGAYALDGGSAQAVTVPAPRPVGGEWHVAFQAGRGAPPAIDLPALQSLHLHADSAVKYFSGTATYSRALDVPAEFLATDRRVVLDLGRVEVIAEVRINGRTVGTVWKEPYRLDVTEAVRAGANALEIAVTTLWPNRLIGDEHLPEENKFGLADERGVEAAGISRLPDWYQDGKPKPAGGRVTFADWRFYDKDEPLVASGLLGPVRVINLVHIVLPER